MILKKRLMAIEVLFHGFIVHHFMAQALELQSLLMKPWILFPAPLCLFANKKFKTPNHEPGPAER